VLADFWANINLLAAEQGLNDTELAKRAKFKHRQQLHLLRRQENVTVRTLERLAGAVGCELKVELHHADN
jgi:DNA-binding Xre family transcriptional regulator